MRKFVLIVLVFLSVSGCGPKQNQVEKLIEDGVEVVVNHLEPYKINGESTALSLEEFFIIDTDKEEFAKVGLGEFARIDVDSSRNIYFWARERAENYIFKFDKDGNFLKSFGRQGQGPGEFQFLTGLENFGQYGISNAPLYAAATKGHLYCVRQKDSGFKELAVYKLHWK